MFSKVYESDESVFVGAPTGSGHLVIAELAMLRELQSEQFQKIVYVCPVESLCKLRYQHFKRKFEPVFGVNVEMITGSNL